MPELNPSTGGRRLALSALVFVLLVAGALLGYARLGDPAKMSPQMRKLAETSWVHNPRAFVEMVDPNWARLCRAWDTWLGELQRKAPQLLQDDKLWTGPDDPVRAALVKFMANADRLRPEVLVPAAAGEKRLAVLAESPSGQVGKELMQYRVANAVDVAWSEVFRFSRQLGQWPHVAQELPGFPRPFKPATAGPG